MLNTIRGYTSRTFLFVNFPRDVRWRRSKLTSGDYERLRYVNSPPWRPLAGSELRVMDGAYRIAENTFDWTISDIPAARLKNPKHGTINSRGLRSWRGIDPS